MADDDGDGVQNGRCAVRGEVTSIYYNSTDVMTPTSVYLDGDEDQEFKLGNSEMQFAFSVYGSLRVGDTVTLICEKTTNAEGDVTYTVIDYVEAVSYTHLQEYPGSSGGRGELGGVGNPDGNACGSVPGILSGSSGGGDPAAEPLCG